MKLSSKVYGYIDTQLTTVIVGILLLIGLVHMITNPEFSINSPSLIIFPGIAVVLAIFAFGCYCNMSSLKCPESPFNKHVSPLFLALIIIGSLAYALWKVNKSPYHYLVFVFGAAIAATVFMGIYLEYVRTRTQKKYINRIHAVRPNAKPILPCLRPGLHSRKRSINGGCRSSNRT